MGFYIEGPATGKGEYLIKTHGAVQCTQEEAKKELVSGSRSVIVILGPFPHEAAGLAHSMPEFNRLTNMGSTVMGYYLLPMYLAHKLANYKKC